MSYIEALAEKVGGRAHRDAVHPHVTVALGGLKADVITCTEFGRIILNGHHDLGGMSQDVATIAARYRMHARPGAVSA